MDSTAKSTNLCLYLFHIDLFINHIICCSLESTAFFNPLLRRPYIITEEHRAALKQKYRACSEKSCIRLRHYMNHLYHYRRKHPIRNRHLKFRVRAWQTTEVGKARKKHNNMLVLGWYIIQYQCNRGSEMCYVPNKVFALVVWIQLQSNCE